MLSCNGLMLNAFVKGLHETDSLTATVTSAAVNFMLSVRCQLSFNVDGNGSCHLFSILQAAGGYVFFQEQLPMRWFLGATIILAGVACLLHGDAAENPVDKRKQQ